MPQTNQIAPSHDAVLMLADGKVFHGYGIGKAGVTTGEICFNTAMTGYQEVLTDPSYTGQVITFTFPHIGNIGANREDIESATPSAAGLIIRDRITPPSNFRSELHLDEWLKKSNITGIAGIDTRALTQHIRKHGAGNVLIAYAEDGKLPKVEELKKKLADAPDMTGLELAKKVTCHSDFIWEQTSWKLEEGYGIQEKPEFHVVAIDYGDKLNILRLLASRGCRITVVPAETVAEDILNLQPDGVFLSNGPGDPAATGKYAVPIIKKLIASGVPLFGICLGHQLLALALGAKTEKMFQGHRGVNHPVKDQQTGKVEITSQNHGFAVAHGSLPKDVEVTHLSLFDGTIQGLRHTKKPIFCVQYHPESSPGPHDSRYLFDRFIDSMKEKKHAKA